MLDDMSVACRTEVAADIPAIRAVNQAAFGSPQEAAIVDVLRESPRRCISLVAESGGDVIGHILFSAVSLDGNEGVRLMGLGPMSVLPAHQRRGIGSALVREGLERCRNSGCSAVVVLGHPAYYPRFGFVPAIHFGVSCEYDVPAEAFMLVELEPGALEGAAGKVVYDEAFGSAAPDHEAGR
jgi:putative acetyltransferase